VGPKYRRVEEPRTGRIQKRCLALFFRILPLYYSIEISPFKVASVCSLIHKELFLEQTKGYGKDLEKSTSAFSTMRGVFDHFGPTLTRASEAI
jgi:hypothetical protein